MPVSVESARNQWDEGHRRLVAQARDPVRYDALLAQVDAVVDELRRRIGETFTLAQLAELYPDAERWSRTAAAERTASGTTDALAIVEDAAFHLYARGAVDFEP